MSVDAGEIEEMDRKELEEHVIELQRELDRLDNMVVGLYEGQLPGVRDRLDAMEEQQEELKSIAETALSVARTEADDMTTPGSKKDIAKRLSRNEVVVQAVVRGTSIHGSVTTPKVSDMAKPDHRLENRSILDAWDEIENEWDCFEVEKGSPGPHGDSSRLKAKSDEVPNEIIRAVANDLTDEEVSEALIMKADSTGGR